MNFFLGTAAAAFFLSMYAISADKWWLTTSGVWHFWVYSWVLYGVVIAVIYIRSWLAHEPKPVAQKRSEASGATHVAASSSASGEENGVQPLFDLSYPQIKLADLSGMQALKQELANALEPFRAYCSGKGFISDSNGILLSGPPGNGKTAFAEAIAGELDLPLIKIQGSDVQSRWINQTGEQIAALFKQAGEQPCVIFFDEFETLAANRAGMSDGTSMEDRKAVTALLPAIENARRKRVVLVAATNYVEQIDSAVIRDGRFDFRIEIPYPDLQARLGILQGLLSKFKLRASQDTAFKVATLWERRSVAFMEATLKKLKKFSGSEIPLNEFKLAAREASRRASAIPTSGPKLSEIAMTQSVRQETDSLIYRLRHWEEITERGGEPPSGVLLYGPPGTGKTFLVRALARELGDWHVFEVSAPDVVRNPRSFRSMVEMASNHRPAIVFIDEADELLQDRTGSVNAGATNEILKCMDGLMGKVPEVVFMAATNNAAFMDAAALRGGRFAEKIFMGPLNGTDLVNFLQCEFTNRKQLEFAPNLTVQTLADRLEEATPAHAQTVLKKAINYTFTAGGKSRAVSMTDVEKAICSLEI